MINNLLFILALLTLCLANKHLNVKYQDFIDGK
jgi:hypothetical protein